MNTDGCCALITGASSGIGRELALQVAQRARAIVLVARRVDRLEELRREINARDPNISIHIRACDLAKRDDVHALIDFLAAHTLEIDLLINNAGLGDRGLFETSDAQRVEEIVAVNVAALTALTRMLLPPMLARKRGAIVNISSCASFLPTPTMAEYGASKAYVTSFSEALRAEVRGTGVSVHTVCPGPVPTEFGNVAGRPGEAYDAGPSFIAVSAARLAAATLRAVELDEALVIPGTAMKIVMALVRSTPLALLRFAARFAVKRPR